MKGEAGAHVKIPVSDSVALRVIKAGTITGADLCAMCHKSINIENYPEGKGSLCKKCMMEIYNAVKEAGGDLK